MKISSGIGSGGNHDGFRSEVVNGAYTFHFTVTQSAVVYIDPAIASGYAFSLPAGKKLDFTESGFPSGVTAFTVIGIDSGAELSVTNTHAFVTGVSFESSGEFLGTMTPLTTASQAAHGGVSSCADLDVIKASFGKKAGQAGFSSLADANLDGVVNIEDLTFAARLLPPGTVCH